MVHIRCFILIIGEVIIITGGVVLISQYFYYHGVITHRGRFYHHECGRFRQFVIIRSLIRQIALEVCIIMLNGFRFLFLVCCLANTALVKNYYFLICGQICLCFIFKDCQMLIVMAVVMGLIIIAFIRVIRCLELLACIQTRMAQMTIFCLLSCLIIVSKILH